MTSLPYYGGVLGKNVPRRNAPITAESHGPLAWARASYQFAERNRYAHIRPPCTSAIGGRTAIGFVLIGTHPAREREVYEKLLKIKEVVELFPLFGEYDLIAKVEAPDYNMIGEIVVSKIRAIDGVRTTKTLARMSF